jgi:hypothetical protein
MLQSAPVWTAFGLVLSPLSTAPIAVAAFLSPLCGIAAFFSVPALLLLLSAQEALIFVFSTGLLGLVLGLTLKLPAALGIPTAGVSLFCGLNMLFYVCGINLFGPFTEYISGFFEIFFLLFSVAYAALWRVILKLLLSRIKGVKT